jgi:carboxypeptidase Taq
MTTLSRPDARSAAASYAYAHLLERCRDAHLIEATSSILGWDQETMMPAGGVVLRGKQQAALARIHHQMSTAREIGDLLAACEADRTFLESGSAEAANVREIRRDYDKATKLPESLVSELAQVSSEAQHEWAKARKASDFAQFLPWLKRLVKLNRDKASCLGIPAGGEAWDALADTFEPGCTAASVTAVFTPLRARLVKLIAELRGAKSGPSNRFNETALPIDLQTSFVRMVTEAIGFDFQRGRLDASTHPFCGGSHCNDVRMTTRYCETCLNDALGSTMHEAGHGMYEQGLPETAIGTPLGTAVSLAIHESQSRLWENQVGRSLPFWKWCRPRLLAHFGKSIEDFTVDDLYGAANIVEPGFIRVEADEATYNLHVMVRFELERLLIGGQLDPADLPTEWNRRYREYLGLEVPDDRRGCLQDVHWSMGAFGYFPTYTLGTLYSAQFFSAARRDLPGLEDGFAAGDFAPLLKWLRTHLHAHGRRYSPAELCERATGKPVSSEPYLEYLEGKLRPLYGL